MIEPSDGRLRVYCQDTCILDTPPDAQSGWMASGPTKGTAMFDTIFGLPVHALVVHAVVVLLPAASITVLAAAFWPWFRRWAGILPLLLSVGATVLIPVATQSGEFLETAIHVETLPAVQKHQQLADLMIYWGIGLVIAAAGLAWWWWQSRPGKSGKPLAQPLIIAIMAVSAIAGVGTAIHVIRVGDAGSRAVWEGKIQDATAG